jgi:energy-converting hydrogenase Eha subunit G
VLAHGGDVIFETKTNMIAAATNVTGHIMTAPELFLALILFMIAVFLSGYVGGASNDGAPLPAALVY